jgi:hypothetical protein
MFSREVPGKGWWEQAVRCAACVLVLAPCLLAPIALAPARAGENRQTLNGNAAPRNGLVVEFSPASGADFVTPGAQGYQSIVAMTVKKYVSGVEDRAWVPDGNVTWTVTSRIRGLSTGAEGVWKRAANAKNGLTWVASASASVDGTTDWRKTGAIRGAAPKGTTAFLADVVGSRTITVVVADKSDRSAGGQTFTFGAGPLSAFRKVGTRGMEWSRDPASRRKHLDSIRYAFNTFPAASFCGGTVNKDVTVTGKDTDANAGFTINSGGGWSSGRQVTEGGRVYSLRYAETSKLAKTDQLLAVAGYDASYNDSGDAKGRKGAALAAGWPIRSHFSYFWTGEVAFAGFMSNFVASVVGLLDGADHRLFVSSGEEGDVFPVCVP